jgi:2'-5' RNA ligase
MIRRLFLAIPFPEEVVEQLEDAQRQLRHQGVRANYSRLENLHLTLAFLGETDREMEIRRVLDAADGKAFSMTVGGWGRFGDLIWAGVRPSRQLTALATQLQDSLRELGFPLEKRPFRPHITLARQCVWAQMPTLQIPDISMTVRQVVLMESSRPGGKLTYTPRHVKALE